MVTAMALSFSMAQAQTPPGAASARSAAVVGIGVGLLARDSQAPSNRADEEAIKAVIDSTTDAFNNHDSRAWLRLATADAELITARGEVMHGAAEIEKGLTALFQGRNKNASVRTLGIRLRFIRTDVALAQVTNEIGGVVDASGETLPASRELSFRVLVKDQGVWRMTAFHNTVVQPSPGAPPVSKNDQSRAEGEVRQLLKDLAVGHRSNGDAKELERLYADEFTTTNASGQVLDKAAVIAARVSGRIRSQSYEFEEITIQIYGDMAIAETCERIEGNPVSGRFRHLRVLIKRDGRWQMVASQMTKIAEQ